VGKWEIVVKSVPRVVETSDRAPTTLLTPLTVDTTYAHFSLWMYPRAVDRQTKTLSNIPHCDVIVSCRGDMFRLVNC
jgi:hypothetical protein